MIAPLRNLCFLALAFLLAVASSSREAAAAAGRKTPGTVDFNRDIRPILAENCFKCHGQDEPARKSNLRLDQREEALQPAKSGARAIVPAAPDQSELLKRIRTSDEDDVMPPRKTGKRLTLLQMDQLTRWIQQGATYATHWAFEPPQRPQLPKVKKKSWPREPLDFFVLARLEKEGLSPSRPGDRARWLRRVTYALTGLPPKPEDTEAFLTDRKPKAFERVVERLLASPQFGERLAQPWLDAARYADSYGYQSDQLSPTWPYRDWVVQAFNDNLSYAQFIREQLAGDLLPSADRRQRLGTAFNRLHRQTNEGGSIEEEWRTEYVADRVHTFGTTFLGLTFECARCHDHKFDPLTMRDYYGLSAFFNSIDEAGLYNDAARVPTPSLLLPTPEQERAMTNTAATRAETAARVQQVERERGAAFETWLAGLSQPLEIPGLIGHFPMDELVNTNQFVNLAQTNLTQTNSFGSTARANRLVEGRSGQALEFTGDDAATLPAKAVEGFRPWDTYSVALWLWLPSGVTNGVIFHRTDGTDVGFHGVELSLNRGRLFFVLKRFWPGNAIAIQARDPLPAEQWVQVAVTYDGSARAGGMRLYVSGRPVEAEVVRDQLFKSPGNGVGGLAFGQRFRSAGLKQGRIDDVRIYNRALSPVEVAHLFDGETLAGAVARRDAVTLRPYFLSVVDSAAAEARQTHREAVRKFFEARDGVYETMVMEEMSEPRPTWVLARGQYDAPKTDAQRVGRATPASMLPMPPEAPRNRLGLAQWLTHPDHPLTARVAVNRFWQILFGRGLVATSENFGTQGAPPTHPELLDWLACDFIDSGWDVKATLRKIVLSATYRQDSALVGQASSLSSSAGFQPAPGKMPALRHRQDAYATKDASSETQGVAPTAQGVLTPLLGQRDPENLLWARGPSHRLPAEMIRDTALAASGLLNPEMGGPPVSPYQPGDLWRESNTMSPAYKQSVGTALYRRSLYNVMKRTAPMPNMLAFDAPSREVCVVKRSNTGTPQQAYVLLNDPQFVEAARVLAERMLREGGAKPEARIRFAFRRLTGREPDARELRLMRELLDEQRTIFAQEPGRAAQLIAVGERKADPALDKIELAAHTALTQAMMNLDATVWLR